jgi:chromosome segregation ATPase
MTTPETTAAGARKWQVATVVLAVLFAGSTAYGVARISQAQDQALAASMDAESQLQALKRTKADLDAMGDLTGRVAELETALIERDRSISRLNEELKTLREQPAARVRPDGDQQAQRDGQPQRGGRGDWQAWQERNPEAATQMRERAAQMAQGVAATLKEQADLLAPVDATRLPADLQEKLGQYKTKLGELSELIAALQDPDAAADQNPMQLQGEVWQGLRELQPLMAAAQEAVYYDMAFKLGYTAETAPEFVAHLQQVQSATSMNTMFQGMRGRRDGDRGRD